MGGMTTLVRSIRQFTPHLAICSTYHFADPVFIRSFFKIPAITCNLAHTNTPNNVEPPFGSIVKEGGPTCMQLWDKQYAAWEQYFNSAYKPALMDATDGQIEPAFQTK